MSGQLLSFSVFALIASITPGPTNILALSSGSRAGVRATLPFVIGASAGASTLLLVTTTGLAQFLFNFPVLQQALAWIGTLWLSFMAWQLFHAPATTPGNADFRQQVPGWYHGAALQAVNPKTWLMALTVSALFLSPAGDRIGHNLQLALIFFVVTCPCIAVWAWLGKGSNRLLKTPTHQVRLNRALAVLLAGSVWWALLGGG